MKRPAPARQRARNNSAISLPCRAVGCKQGFRTRPASFLGILADQNWLGTVPARWATQPLPPTLFHDDELLCHVKAAAAGPVQMADGAGKGGVFLVVKRGRNGHVLSAILAVNDLDPMRARRQGQGLDGGLDFGTLLIGRPKSMSGRTGRSVWPESEIGLISRVSAAPT